MPAMGTLYASFFFLEAIFCIVSPFLQVILRNCGYSYTQIGFLLAVYELSGVAGPLVTGVFVDKTGRMKLTMALSLIISFLGFCVVVFTHKMALTVLSLCFASGFLRSMLTLQDTMAMQRVGGDVQKYSVIRSMGTAGFVFFCLLYTFMHRPYVTDNLDIFRFLSFGFLICFCTSCLGKESGAVPQKTKEEEKDGRWFDGAFLLGLGCIALSRFGMSVTSFLSLYMVEELGLDQISLINALAAFSEFFAMLLSGYLMEKRHVSAIVLLFASSLSVVLRLLLYAFVPSLTGVILAQCTHSLSYGVFQPASIMFVHQRVKHTHLAAGISLCLSLGTGLPTMLGDTIGGYVVQSYGYKVLFESFSIPALLSALLFLLFYRPLTKTPIEAR